MDGNDTLGDCVIAGVDHVIARENAIEHTNDARPEPRDHRVAVPLFLAERHGCVMADVLQAWRTKGLFHHMPSGPNQISQYAPFDYANKTELSR